jgi:EcsC protein family
VHVGIKTLAMACFFKCKCLKMLANKRPFLEFEMLSKSELDDLKRAKQLLENPGLAARLSSMLGSPIERGMAMLPARFQTTVHKASEAAMMKALDVAVKSMGSETVGNVDSKDRLHKIAAATSGAVGGAFGLLALTVELPVSTTIMLRSIADIAKSEGENIAHIETRLDCLTVFALGGRSASDNAAESGYFAARMAMASAVSEATKFLAEKGMSKAGAPALVRLTSLIASRFGIVVSEKAAAQAVPIIGAASGALINTLFIEHFQNTARGHFTVRRLEKIHGVEPIRLAYEKI